MTLDELIPSILTKWASDPSGIPSHARESLCASLAGGVATESVIAKLASAGDLSREEADYLRALNLEVMQGELSVFTKSAGVPEWIGNAMMTPMHYPKTTGAILGGAVGAGIGAWKDDENRLRGALLYGVPGAVVGGVGGAVAGDMMDAWGERQAQKLLAQTQALHPDANHLRELRHLGREQSQVMRAQRRVVPPDAAGDAARAMNDFDQRVISRASDKAKAIESVAAAKTLAQQAEAAAMERMMGAYEDAEKWHATLLGTAHRLNDPNNPNPKLRAFAENYIPTLNARKDQIIRHAYDRPGTIHGAVVNDHFNERPLLEELHREAAKYLRLTGGT